jgi:hypothetical protein
LAYNQLKSNHRKEAVMDFGPWVKSSYSFANGNCVEARWVSASASGDTNCVQARPAGGGVQLRDSKDPDGPVLTFTAPEWEAFLAGARKGEFDDIGRS